MTVRELITKLGFEVNDSGIKKADAALAHFSRRTTEMGRKLSIGLSLPLLALSGGAIKASIDFNKAMANVATLIPGNAERVKVLKKEVQNLAIETGKSTEDLSGGLYQVISAFGDGADTAKILGISAKAAVAGVASVSDALELTSAVTKAYGDTSAIAVQQAADLSFQAVKDGQTTFPELAASIGRAAPLAAALGVSQAELFGVMASGTGVTGKAAEVATQYRGILQALLVPSERLKKLLKAQGYESSAAMIRQLGMQKSLQLIADEAAKCKTPLQDFITSIEGQTLALALTQGQAGKFTAELKAMEKAVGMTNEAYKEQTEGINKEGHQLEILKQKVIVTAQSFGDKLAPSLIKIVDALTPLLDKIAKAVEWFGKLDDSTQQLVMGFGLAVIAIGPLLVGLGQIAGAINLITKAVIALQVAEKGSMLLSKWGLAAGGAGAVLAGGKWLIDELAKASGESYKSYKGFQSPALALAGAPSRSSNVQGPTVISQDTFRIEVATNASAEEIAKAVRREWDRKQAETLRQARNSFLEVE